MALLNSKTNNIKLFFYTYKYLKKDSPLRAVLKSLIIFKYKSMSASSFSSTAPCYACF